MAVVDVLDQNKNVVGEFSLDDQVFKVKVRPEILNMAVKAHLANKRTSTASVKTRSTIRGGGRKPWRQKGTGRARAGSVRSPLWKGGAIIHGPNNNNYQLKVNKKVKKLALKMALSSKLAEENLVVIDKFDVQRPKTKDFVAIKNILELQKALIVLPQRQENLELAARNVPKIKIIQPEQLNTYEVLHHSMLVLTPEAAQNIQERLQ